MTRLVMAGLSAVALLVMTGCGGDNTTTFVVQSPTPAASGSPTGAASASPSPASSSPPTTAATPIEGGLKIIIDSPDASSAISSPVQVTGTASVDNGTVVASVLDAAGNELGRATTLASAAKPEFGHYDVSVSFTGVAGKRGQIKVFGVSPRDGKTPTNFYFITVTFA
jgi:immunoglobulin-like protein involved in spore germination